MPKSVSLQEGSCKEKHALGAGETFEKLENRIGIQKYEFCDQNKNRADVLFNFFLRQYLAGILEHSFYGISA